MSGLIGLGGYGSDSDSDSASGSPGSRTRASSSGEMEVDGKDVITVGDGDASMDEEEIVNADAAAEFSSELRRMSSAGLPISIQLPPPPTGKIDQNSKVQYFKMLDGYKKGMNINKQIKSAKSYRNPSIYSKLIDYFNIKEGGSNFPKDVFDPTKLKNDTKFHYKELSKLQNQLEEKRQKEEKQRILLAREKEAGPAVVSSRSKNHNGKSIPAVGILAKKTSKDRR
ncbi:Oidioi.mRNA.OKI2018_I69.XSR.g13660.t2.cds [Oikopleura dioica]|uniref:Oidioi.mRNA.OKI2018_I69.XSR.g13660.t2.cds n=1 Tax=Oikopleura dioica TaxID=34765 RepID=A0ABN7S7H7_OIKDI|nr:Oidioi.mRNA.OKI2018_I69.XSR.g13660.t2.cds [Oikopleura dioica]